jgi:hypothetical protein
LRIPTFSPVSPTDTPSSFTSKVSTKSPSAKGTQNR